MRKILIYISLVYLIGWLIGILFIPTTNLTLNLTHVSFESILKHNNQVNIRMIVSGFLSGGFLSSLLIFINAIFFGNLIKSMIVSKCSTRFWLMILPHYPFELTSYIIAFIISLSCYSLIKKIKDFHTYQIPYGKYLKLLLLNQLLLIIAAFIEGGL